MGKGKKEIEKMFEENINLVHYVARTIFLIQPSYYEYDDIISAGMVGLYRSVSNFDTQKECKFSYYAIPIIKSEMSLYFKANTKYYVKKAPLEENIGAEEDITKKLDSCYNFCYMLNIIFNKLAKVERVIILYTMAGLTQKEIGINLKSSYQYVGNEGRKAKKKLKELYELNKPINNPSFMVNYIKEGYYELKFSVEENFSIEEQKSSIKRLKPYLKNGEVSILFTADEKSLYEIALLMQVLFVKDVKVEKTEKTKLKFKKDSKTRDIIEYISSQIKGEFEFGQVKKNFPNISNNSIRYALDKACKVYLIERISKGRYKVSQ